MGCHDLLLSQDIVPQAFLLQSCQEWQCGGDIAAIWENQMRVHIYVLYQAGLLRLQVPRLAQAGLHRPQAPRLAQAGLHRPQVPRLPQAGLHSLQAPRPQ